MSSSSVLNRCVFVDFFPAFLLRMSMQFSRQAISHIAIDVTIPFCGLSVWMSRSCLVLKRLKISAQFLWHTTVPCLPQFVLKFESHRSTSSTPNFTPMCPTSCWFQCRKRKHSTANCSQMVIHLHPFSFCNILIKLRSSMPIFCKQLPECICNETV